MQPYTDDYHDQLHPGSMQSAREVVPLVLRLLVPRSVIDVGCGRGAWLAVFQELGVTDIRGLDGDYVCRDKLAFPNDCFSAHDLTRPFRLDRSFDLVVSLEVAEHLPADCANAFVVSLTELGPVVLFSAAAPFQGGKHHVNEQWPAYWAERFRSKGYVPVDCLRRRIWLNPKVEWWYAQNVFLYVDQNYLQSHVVLRREYESAGPDALSLVHPRRYLEWIEWGTSQYQSAVHGETSDDRKL
jgi:SAM-dependent methyltransferase